MGLKLAIYPGYDGKFLLLNNKQIILDKKIPIIEEQGKKILYGQIQNIINEVKTKVKELESTVKVYILDMKIIRESANIEKERYMCSGIIQGILIANNIKYMILKEKHIKQELSKPHKLVSKNLELSIIMNYGKDFIDINKDTITPYLLVMLSLEE
jgi:hypothetical protein